MKYIPAVIGGAVAALILVGPEYHQLSHSYLTTVPPDLPQVRGATSPRVNQSNIHFTVCVRGYTSTVRPPERYTTNLKRRQIRDLQLTGTVHDYEEDHFIPLSLGGAPYSPQNLWPESWPQAHRSDPLEYRLYRQVCGGEITLKHARNQIRTYKERYG